MQVQIWIQEEDIDNLIKVSNEQYSGDAEEIFEDSVEFTKVVTMEGQVAIYLSLDMYVRLTDNELLTEWSLEY